MWIQKKVRFLVPLASAICLMIISVSVLHSQERPFDWRTDWEIEEGFSIAIDTEGYEFPTAIAFVPNPSDDPQAPLYYVTEFNGKVKVVTNDRTVYTFADLELDIPPPDAEAGMAGICLAPEHGYVFVTFTNKDGNGILKNDVVRFDTHPQTFSLSPTSRLAFTEVFSSYSTTGSHQVGPCQVENDLLYVSVGDGGFNPQTSQNLNSMLGKVVRMTLDGKPVPENPFYQDDNIKSARNYVWSYGLKNPFGLKVVNGRVFVADNGGEIDRFVEIHEGENYLWDGTDGSIASRADYLIIPGPGVVQMDYYPEGSAIFPEQYRNRFYQTLSNGNRRSTGVLPIEYDFESNALKSVPNYFLRHRPLGQVLTGLAFGPDGLYIVPMRPNRAGMNAVLRITYDPANQHPFTLSQGDGHQIMYQKGCVACHKIPNVVFGVGSEEEERVGPSLDGDLLVSRLQRRLNSQEYIESLEEIDQIDQEPFVSFRQARQEVVNAEGMDRVRTWIRYRVQEPRFDNLDSRMPNLGISEKEAVLIANALLEGSDIGLLESFKGKVFPERVGRRHLAMYFAVGFMLGLFALVSAYVIARQILRAVR